MRNLLTYNITMSYELEQRYLNRYESAIGVKEDVLNKVTRILEDNPDQLDLTNRLLLTPQFIWEELFNRGLPEELFKNNAKQALELVVGVQVLRSQANWLVEACQPEQRLKQTLDLTTVSLVGGNTIEVILSFLGEESARTLLNIQQSATDKLLPSLGTEDIPLARFRLDALKGRGMFPFGNLVDGGVRYSLPTRLEGVRLSLTYTGRFQYPVAGLIVNPLDIPQKPFRFDF